MWYILYIDRSVTEVIVQTLTINISDEIYNDISNIQTNKVEELIELGLRELKVKRVLNQYTKGEISFGRAAEIAGLRQDDLALKAYANGIYPQYSNQTVLEELE